MTVLGDRSPMEVVMGLKPLLPATLTQALPVEHMGISDYVVGLVEDLMKGYKEILELGREANVVHEGEDAGRVESLQVGDTVMVRKAVSLDQKECCECFRSVYNESCQRISVDGNGFFVIVTTLIS